ncbi:unnamed protein product [Rotaria sp. Silwood2]|nr:unnamed protein product [Rotaria sp. Silwood2]CAF2828955.1 unnamed protein product [Rotaria sp. Silwood2]CAF3326197.1 unnamed protein product [Rotaria sp. Silwood2]CAF4046918.1 unnamed protein product [Rotaria sp. Silwood2]CAF4294436.1 unnamed protein product [Rotaria sp. Silwood2]
MAISQSVNRRIQSELRLLINDPQVKLYFHYETSGYYNNDQSKPFLIYGYILPRAFPYKYGSFKIKLRLPYEYPFRMPEVIFLTQIYHPQIQYCGKELVSYCCERCENWVSTMNLAKWIERVVDKIDQTNPDSFSNPRNFAAQSHYFQNRDDYWRTVINMIEKYSYRRTDESTMSLKFISKRFIRAQLGFDSKRINQLPLPEVLKRYLHSSFDQKQKIVNCSTFSAV